MAKILRKIPKRNCGKYADIGQSAEDVLSQIRDINELATEIKSDKELTNDEKCEYINCLQKLALSSCSIVSYYKGNGLNTFQNAEKTGLTQNLNDKQINVLKKISRNTEMARILFATGKYSSYVMLALALGTLYIQGHNKFVYNLIQPEETYMFISVAIFALYCILKHKNKTINTSPSPLQKQKQKTQGAATANY